MIKDEFPYERTSYEQLQTQYYLGHAEYYSDSSHVLLSVWRAMFVGLCSTAAEYTKWFLIGIVNWLGSAVIFLAMVIYWIVFG